MTRRRDFEKISEVIGNAGCIAVAGHLHPDGDCAGSVLALSAYLKKEFPGIPVDTYLEEMPSCFDYLPGMEGIKSEDDGGSPDLLFLLDTSAPDRVGAAPGILARAKRVVLIDHHISNPGFGDLNVIEPDKSSASEVLYTLLDPEKIDLPCAAALYTGIVHDSGIFRYSCTGPETLRIAADLISRGVPFTRIIEKTFEERSYTETRILGEALRTARLFAGGRAVISSVTRETMLHFGAEKRDVDGVVAELRKTAGCEAAVFLYPADTGYKASLRSRSFLDVSKVAALFGGGGHIRAAGCSMDMDLAGAESLLMKAVEEALVRSDENADDMRKDAVGL
ncbi:MAG: bifunctional oligoribonuclease/PAP phosphatase NrnA [Lachnospiraceae bacterium]|nr:bifunctional oligoribonuclease/PAP phosphatase NrnA [Lachnospiraceae bacterium]